MSGNGWATAATIDIIYDVLHMMGRDDVPVGLGNLIALGAPSLGCKYVKAIPQGSGGLLDSDTLYGLGRTLPRSPRRYIFLHPATAVGFKGNIYIFMSRRKCITNSDVYSLLVSF